MWHESKKWCACLVAFIIVAPWVAITAWSVLTAEFRTSDRKSVDKRESARTTHSVRASNDERFASADSLLFGSLGNEFDTEPTEGEDSEVLELELARESLI